MEAVLAAFIEPGLRAMEAEGPRRAVLYRLVSKIEALPAAETARIYRAHFGEVCGRFLEALAKALPDLPAEVLGERFRFVLAVLSSLSSERFDLSNFGINGAVSAEPDLEGQLTLAVGFLAGGLRAPVPEPELMRAPDEQTPERTREDTTGVER